MSECQIIDSDGTVRRTCDVDETLLADSRRRTVVRTLETAPKNWTDRESLLESLPTSEAMTTDEWALEIAHVHLPLLEERGLVEYDAHSETIRYFECDLVSRVLGSIKRATVRAGDRHAVPSARTLDAVQQTLNAPSSIASKVPSAAILRPFFGERQRTVNTGAEGYHGRFAPLSP